jgi:hypothetical protein
MSETEFVLFQNIIGGIETFCSLSDSFFLSIYDRKERTTGK